MHVVRRGGKSKMQDTPVTLERDPIKANPIKHHTKISFTEEDVCNQLKRTFVHSNAPTSVQCIFHKSEDI